MIKVQDLSKSYGGVEAIKLLNFEIKKGEVVGFLGPNGAGKSTTMKIITGFMAPSSGAAYVGGYDVFENPIEVKKQIGYLPETPPVYTDMRVNEYLSYVAELKGVPSRDLKKKVNEAIEKTSLGDVQKRMIYGLSKGFKQRVGLAQALVSDPEVLILDEPTVGLDPKQVSEIRNLIQGLRGHHTVILSTHILPEVQATCERLIIINRGQIVAQDTLKNLSDLQRGARQVHLKVRKAAPEIASVIKQVTGVLKVQAGNTDRDWTVDTQESDEVIEAIASQVIQKGFGLMEISSAKMDLEDIFLKLTYGEKHV